MIAISPVILFLVIQYFLVGVIGDQISRYDEQAAIEYCELIGRKAEEYKTLNGVYPGWNMDGLDEIPRPPFLIIKGLTYQRAYRDEGPYCEYAYWKENSQDYKMFFIRNKKWELYTSR